MNPLAFQFAVLAISVAILLGRLISLERRLDRLSRVEAKLDVALRSSGITFDPFVGLPAEVREAVSRGERIQAIKSFRQATGIGLKEAKDWVDELCRRMQ